MPLHVSTTIAPEIYEVYFPLESYKSAILQYLMKTPYNLEQIAFAIAPVLSIDRDLRHLSQ